MSQGWSKPATAALGRHSWRGSARWELASLGRGLSRLSRARFDGMHQWNIYQMLAQKPHLQFVGTQNIADYQVIRAVVAQFGSASRQLPAVANNNLMRVQQTRNLNRRFLSAAWWTFDARGLGNIGGHGQRNSAEQLDALGDLIDDLHLLVIMLVEQ